MAAKGKPVDQLTVSDLGLAADQWAPSVGEEVVSIEAAEERKAGEIVVDEGEASSRSSASLRTSRSFRASQDRNENGANGT